MVVGVVCFRIMLCHINLLSLLQVCEESVVRESLYFMKTVRDEIHDVGQRAEGDQISMSNWFSSDRQ